MSYSGDWIDSICFDPGFIGLVLKIQVLEDVGTNLYSADTINQYIRQNYAD